MECDKLGMVCKTGKTCIGAFFRGNTRCYPKSANKTRLLFAKNLNTTMTNQPTNQATNQLTTNALKWTIIHCNAL